MVLLFAAATLVGAALLFIVQPLVARLLLPLLGRSPSVRNTCMLFFQTALLAGYGYAHVLTRRLAPRAQIAVHLAVVAAAFAALPIAVRGVGPPPPPRALRSSGSSPPSRWQRGSRSSSSRRRGL